MTGCNSEVSATTDDFLLVDSVETCDSVLGLATGVAVVTVATWAVLAVSITASSSSSPEPTVTVLCGLSWFVAASSTGDFGPSAASAVGMVELVLSCASSN